MWRVKSRVTREFDGFGEALNFTGTSRSERRGFGARF
jgi:hypothetical protein